MSWVIRDPSEGLFTSLGIDVSFAFDKPQNRAVYCYHLAVIHGLPFLTLFFEIIFARPCAVAAYLVNDVIILLLLKQLIKYCSQD